MSGHGPGFPCQRESHGYCRVCDLITPGSPHYSTDYHRRFDPATAPPTPEPAPCPEPSPSPPALEGPSVARSLANIAQVKACPSWEATSSCGCGMNRCKAGKGRAGDGAVSYEDCFACLNLS